jgi:hypothetical protein
MAKIQTLSDEQLLQRASYAGRSLIVLAILMTICTAAAVLVAILYDAGSESAAAQSDARLLSLFLRLLPVTVCLMAAGLWLLALAARRGNATAPGVVLLVLAFQMLLSLAGSCTALSHGVVPMSLLVAIAALVVAVAVSIGRNVLMEMKKRGLWEAKFAAAKASRGLCVCGGILLLVGYIGANTSLLVPAVLAAQDVKKQAKEIEQAKAFFACVTELEPGAIDALHSLGKTRDSQFLRAAIGRVDALDRKVASIQREVAPDVPLCPILAKYRRALADLKNGLTELGARQPDAKKAKQLLESGARLRAEAAREFAGRYLHH